MLHALHASNKNEVLLQVTRAFVLNRNDLSKRIQIHVLFDTGSQFSYVIKVVSSEFYFHKPITVQIELYLFYHFIHFLLYIGQY